MKEIRLRLSETDLAVLDHESAQTGLSRADLLRCRATASRRYDPSSYALLVSKAARIADLPRSQVERIVNFTFVELMGSGG
jgi:hypothetical protein